MEIKSDLPLRGAAWDKALKSFDNIFTGNTHYKLFMLSISIGIMYDKRLVPEKDEFERMLPRNVIKNHENGNLDFMFQAAILTTKTKDLEEDERLELAFADNVDFNKLAFLTEFANFGVTKLLELKGDTTIETMMNIRDFLTSTVKGKNFDIDDLPDDILLED